MLVDDGEVIAETTCIIEHLQARHPGPDVWIPDGEEGRRVRFLDRFFDLHIQGNMQPSVNHALRPPGCGDPFWRRAGTEERCALPTTGSKRTCPMPNGQPATHSRSPTARRLPRILC